MCTDSIFVQVTSAVERWSEGESFSRGVNTRAPTIRLIIYWSGEGEFPFTVCLSLPCHCECACHAYVCVHRLDEDPATSPLVPNFLNKSQNRKLRHLRGSLNVARPRRDYRSNFFPLYVRLPVLRLSKQQGLVTFEIKRTDDRGRSVRMIETKRSRGEKQEIELNR